MKMYTASEKYAPKYGLKNNLEKYGLKTTFLKSKCKKPTTALLVQHYNFNQSSQMLLTLPASEF